VISPRDENALDGKPVLQAEKDLDRAVRGNPGSGDPEGTDPRDVLHLCTEFLGEVRHLVKGDGPLPVDPLQDLPRPVFFLAVFRDEGLDLAESHVLNIGIGHKAQGARRKANGSSNDEL